MEELDAIVQDWSVEWHNPVSQEELSKEPPPDAPKDLAQKELSAPEFDTLLHFDQKSDGRIVGFLTLPCRMYDTMISF